MVTLSFDLNIVSARIYTKRLADVCLSHSSRCVSVCVILHGCCLIVDKATDGNLPSEDWALNMEICDIINETDEGFVCKLHYIRFLPFPFYLFQ